MKFELIFMGDSYTVGWGLWYHYWCKNKLYNHIDLYEKYMDVDAVHSGFIDNEALNFTWSNRFPALVASHFNTDYRTNCWEDIGHFSSHIEFPLSRERVHTAATKLMDSYLKYFERYGNKVRRFFILQTSEVTRDTLLKNLGLDVEIDDKIKKIIGELTVDTTSWNLSKPEVEEKLSKNVVTKLIINSEDPIFNREYIKGIPYPKKAIDLLKDDNFEKVLYYFWETIWRRMEVELKKYNCELLLVHNQGQFHDNCKLQNVVHIGPDGSIDSLSKTIKNYTVEKEIYYEYNRKILEEHPGLQSHRSIADSIIEHIEDYLI
jgi:hypothetical protein